MLLQQKDGCDFLATSGHRDESLRHDRRALRYDFSSSRRADRVLFIGASSTDTTSIVALDLTTKRFEVLRDGRGKQPLTPDIFPLPEPLSFPPKRGLTAHGNFYPPQNRDYAAPEDEKPPLLVMSHGGPTSSSSASLKYSIQYWTSRGIAVLDVNYGGSSGYGARLPRTAERPMGHRRRRRLRQRRALSRRNAAKSTAIDWRSVAAAPAATRRSARSLSVMFSKPAPATTASAISKRWPKTPTSSSRAISTA